MTVTITVHGGAEEIGSSKILVEDKGHDVKFFLDFGKNFEAMRQYYDFPVQPGSLEELLRIEATPDLPGLYHLPESKEQPKTDVDAVLLTHAHTDHCGYIPLLNRSIKMYMGECTRRVFEARIEGSRKRFDTNIEGLEIETFKTGKTFKVGGVEVQPVHVDHSIPGAYGFVIHLSEGILVYTGDFRRHGTRPQLTQDFIDAIQQAGPPDIVLSEGTNIGKAELTKEAEVRRQIEATIKKCRGLAIVDFSEVDFDRFRTMHGVAKATNRELVIEPRRMWMLDTLNKCSELSTPSITKDTTIRRYAPEKKRLSSYEKLLSESKPPLKDYEGRGVKPAELRANPRRYLLATSFGNISLLQRVKPTSGIYLLSASEPFNEESEISFDKLLNWLTLSGLAMYTAHCSGHVDPLGLRQTLEEMKPKSIYPIHTENPRLFKRFLEPSGLSIVIPKQGVPFKL